MPDLRAAPSDPGPLFMISPIALVAMVSNDGIGASPSAQVTFLLSVDATLDPGDVLIGDCFTSAIPATAASPCDEDAAAIPAGFGGITPDTQIDVHFFSCADSLAIIPEADESNNCEQVQTILVPEPSSILQLIVGLACLHAMHWRRRSC
jgi:hypothetical protein